MNANLFFTGPLKSSSAVVELTTRKLNTNSVRCQLKPICCPELVLSRISAAEENSSSLFRCPRSLCGWLEELVNGNFGAKANPELSEESKLLLNVAAEAPP